VFERFTPRARAVLNAAADQATRRGHGDVESGDLLLALFEPRGSIAADLLLAAGIKRADCEKQLSPGTSETGATKPSGRPPLSIQAKHVLKSALEEALRLRHNYIGTEHLLLGLYQNLDDEAAKTLATLGLTYEDAKRRVAEALEKFQAAG
jgi:ATP-dependent Clp protease ATP-binding subunit ClpA